LVLFGGFFLVNLTLAVITIHFIYQQKVTTSKWKKRAELTEEEKKKSWHISTFKKLKYKRYHEPYSKVI